MCHTSVACYYTKSEPVCATGGFAVHQCECHHCIHISNPCGILRVMETKHKAKAKVSAEDRRSPHQKNHYFTPHDLLRGPWISLTVGGIRFALADRSLN